MSARELQLRLQAALQLPPHRSPVNAEAHHHLRHEVELVLLRADQSGQALDPSAATEAYFRSETLARRDSGEPRLDDVWTGPAAPDEPSLF
jgi:hypothetical protein